MVHSHNVTVGSPVGRVKYMLLLRKTYNKTLWSNVNRMYCERSRKKSKDRKR